jgi:hypothetical protein
MSAKSFVPAKNASTWEVISNRLAKFVPPIDLAGYIAAAAPPPQTRCITRL